MKKFAIALLCLSTCINSQAHGTLITRYGARLVRPTARVLRSALQKRSLSGAAKTETTKQPKSSKFLKGVIAGAVVTFGGEIAAERNGHHLAQKANEAFDELLSYFPYPGV